MRICSSYRILIARGGEEAVNMFSANRDSVALVLLDVIMPRLGGLGVYTAISALQPTMPVVFATGYSNETAALAEFVKRGIPVLKKPYSPTVLCRQVRETLDRTFADSHY